ncbi:hypothetical protein quinque_015278 [Culex quinquefasciatus]
MEPMQLEQLEVKPQIVSSVPSGGGVDSSNPSSVTGAGAASNACSDLQQETKKQEQKQKVAEIEILPVIYEIIRSVEKDPVDNAAKQKESADCSQKVLELQKTLEAARATIRQLPGIEFSKEEQLRRLESLRKQLALKQQLIKKYKNQLIQRLADSYPMRRAAQLLVSAYYRGRTMAQEQKFIEMTPERFKRMMETFRQDVKKELEQAKEDLKRREGRK